MKRKLNHFRAKLSNPKGMVIGRWVYGEIRRPPIVGKETLNWAQHLFFSAQRGVFLFQFCEAI